MVHNLQATRSVGATQHPAGVHAEVQLSVTDPLPSGQCTVQAHFQLAFTIKEGHIQKQASFTFSAGVTTVQAGFCYHALFHVTLTAVHRWCHTVQSVAHKR